MNNGLMARGTTFFTPKTAYQYSQAITQNFMGNEIFLAPNPPYGAELVYRLTSGTSRDTTRIVVTNIRGDTVRTLNGPGGAGLHRAYWGSARASTATRARRHTRQHHRCSREAPT